MQWKYNQELPCLERDAAIALLKDGPDKWNEWVEKNPEANINFSGGCIDKGESGAISFSGFHFPKGLINFGGVHFKGQDLNFDKAVFSGGQLIFNRANLDFKSVNFDGIDFGGTNVMFDETVFNSPDGVTFSGSIFSGYVSFHSVKFGVANGSVDFSRCQFKDINCNVSFRHSSFKCRRVNFNETVFENNNVDFHATRFELTGNDTFELNVTKARFSDAALNFSNVEFIAGCFHLDFDGSIFNGSVNFQKMKGTRHIEVFNFRHCTFEKSFNIAHNHFNCIPDLTYTKIAHHVSVDAVTINVKKQLNQFVCNEVVDIGDIERVRRLKNLAEESKDHQSMIDFHIEELRAKRWVSTKGVFPLLLSYLYDIFGGFGRSYKKPIIWLLMVWVSCAGYYHYASDNPCIYGSLINAPCTFESFSKALQYSFTHLMPAIPASKALRQQNTEYLFGKSSPDGVLILAVFETMIGALLLFLFILALRNQFKVKG
ncbi:hypothetical protein [uncultured Shewanella sp.]|uniref:pentapeptide repeat-containing protein n=1 Tax=uncultured Shewanella sp. TaxID=173975 RepID=UPI002607FF51|nr:hypothetical protein [uncultured Shewanella sp.]